MINKKKQSARNVVDQKMFKSEIARMISYYDDTGFEKWNKNRLLRFDILFTG